MLTFFKNLKIFHKLIFINILFMVGTCVDVYLSLDTIRDTLVQEKKIKLKNFVESASSYINSTKKDVERGLITESAAKERVTQYVNGSRFDGGNYFWINDLNGKMITHPIKQELNDTDVMDMQDPNGLYLFREFIKIANEEKEGYVEYQWPKPGEKDPINKISFVSKIDGWDWIIGSGYYETDLNSILFNLMMHIIMIIAPLFVFIQMLIVLIYRSIANPLSRLAQLMQQISQGATDVQIPKVHTKNELGIVYQSLDGLYETVLNNIRLDSGFKSMDTMILITDHHGIITQINPALHLFFEEKARKYFSKHLPESIFEKGLMNINIKELDPILQDSLATMNNAVYTSIDLEDCYITIHATPIINKLGEKLGLVVQFVDMTNDKQIRGVIENAMMLATSGDLSVRIDTIQLQGYFKPIAERVNILIESIETTMFSVARTMKSLSMGDLTTKVEGSYIGVIAALQTDINRAVENLQFIMRRIIVSSQKLVEASDNINKGGQELSQRTEQQASSLEETAASMEELASTVRQTAEHAKGANELAYQAQELAQDGGVVVSDAIKAMEFIDESSKKVSSIMVVIDEIAFQTNLLALNAAVEAARAGESGKGFAVVAEEVRTLAQRSAQASKQIKTFMDESTINVKNGVVAVHHAGERLQEIVSASKDVASLISEIANASQEQTSGLEQINTAVAEMDHMTQENAALVEKSSASADALSHQADDLMSMMSFFKFNFEVGEEENTDQLMVVPINNGVTPPQPKKLETVLDFNLDLPEEEHQKPASTPKPTPSSKSFAISNDPDWQDF